MCDFPFFHLHCLLTEEAGYDFINTATCLTLATSISTHPQVLSVSPEPVANRPRCDMGFPPPPFLLSLTLTLSLGRWPILQPRRAVAGHCSRFLWLQPYLLNTRPCTPAASAEHICWQTARKKERRGGETRPAKKTQLLRFAIEKIQMPRLGLNIFAFLFCSGLSDPFSPRGRCPDGHACPLLSVSPPALLAADRERGRPSAFPRARVPPAAPASSGNARWATPLPRRDNPPTPDTSRRRARPCPRSPPTPVLAHRPADSRPRSPPPASAGEPRGAGPVHP